MSICDIYFKCVSLNQHRVTTTHLQGDKVLGEAAMPLTQYLENVGFSPPE